MYGLAKHPFTVTTGKCMTEDEEREVVKGHSALAHFCSAQHSPLRARRTELSAFWKAFKWYSRIVCRIHVDSITPPFLNAVQANRAIFRVLQGKEDDEHTDCITCIQSNPQNV